MSKNDTKVTNQSHKCENRTKVKVKVNQFVTHVKLLQNSDDEQVKAVRKRLLETPKESGNEEVTYFFLEFHNLIFGLFLTLFPLPGEQEDAESSEDPGEDGQPEHLRRDRPRYHRYPVPL